MKSNVEIRAESLAIARGRWFWVVLGASLLLQWICQLALHLIANFNESMGVVSPAAYLTKKFEMLRQGLDYTLPTAEAYRQMAYAGTLEVLVGYILVAVALFGITAVVLKAIANDRKGVIPAAFGGFARPLGVTWLLLVTNVFVSLWMLLLVIPGIVAIYRYRAVWYLKSEHPDWGALKCLGESKRIMRGRKFQAFMLDMSFILLALLLMILFGVLLTVAKLVGAAFSEPVANLVITLAYALAFMVGMFLSVWYSIARTVFYRETRDSAPCPAES